VDTQPSVGGNSDGLEAGVARVSEGGSGGQSSIYTESFVRFFHTLDSTERTIKI